MKNHYPLVQMSFAFVFFSLIGYSEPTESKTAAQVQLGRQLVKSKNCAICHAIDGVGGKMAGPLNGITTGKTDEFLRGSLLTPKTTIGPRTTMPAYKFNAEEVAAVIAFMKEISQPTTERKE